MQRVFIIHGWTTHANEDWLPWVAGKLSGFEVHLLDMPNTDHPIINVWVSKIVDEVGQLKPDDVFIGHSLGCQAILRFLETQPLGSKVGKLVLVAGAQKLSKEAIPLPEDEKIFAPWRDTPIDFHKIKTMTNKIYAIFSDDDPWVLIDENAPIYKMGLNAQIIIEKGKKHFMKNLGEVEKLPIVLDVLRK